MRQRQRRCSAKRRSWAYTRHSLGAARRCVEAWRRAPTTWPGRRPAAPAPPRTGAARRVAGPTRRAGGPARGGASWAWRRRRAPSVCPAFGRAVVARQPHGAALARRGARTLCSRAHAMRLVVGRRGRHAVDLSWAFGLPIVLKACDKQHAEDERHNKAPARAWREECTTDGLRE